jgi:hypothetical protein
MCGFYLVACPFARVFVFVVHTNATMKVVVPVLVLLICICQLSGSIKRLASFAVKSPEFKVIVVFGCFFT